MNEANPLKAYLGGSDVTVIAVATDLKIDRITLWRWTRDGVPVKRLVDVERVTGIPRERLRPDIFRASAA